jgi:hypothetical protein
MFYIKILIKNLHTKHHLIPIIDSIENEILDDLVCGSLITDDDAEVGFELNKFEILISCGDV